MQCVTMDNGTTHTHLWIKVDLSGRHINVQHIHNILYAVKATHDSNDYVNICTVYIQRHMHTALQYKQAALLRFVGCGRVDKPGV